MVICTKCLAPKAESEFGRNRHKRNGLQSWCRDCCNSYDRSRYKNPVRNADVKRRTREVTVANRAIMDAAKDVPCARCDERYPPHVMDFHHRDPAEKETCVAWLDKASVTKLLAEIAKCDVLCSNCHRQVEHDLRAQGGEASPVVAAAAA